MGESDMLGVSERDIFAPQMRYYLAMRDSDMFACGERGGKHATYKSSRRAVRGISRRRHIALLNISPVARYVKAYRKSVRIYIALVCLLRQTN